MVETVFRWFLRVCSKHWEVEQLVLNRSSCSGHLYWESGGGMPPKVEPEPTEGGGDDEGKTTGGCCCKGKVAPDGPVEVNPDYWADKRNCWSHDPCFCILFLAYWVGWSSC